MVDQEIDDLLIRKNRSFVLEQCHQSSNSSNSFSMENGICWKSRIKQERLQFLSMTTTTWQLLSLWFSCVRWNLFTMNYSDSIVVCISVFYSIVYLDEQQSSDPSEWKSLSDRFYSFFDLNSDDDEDFQWANGIESIGMTMKKNKSCSNLNFIVEDENDVTNVLMHSQPKDFN